MALGWRLEGLGEEIYAVNLNCTKILVINFSKLSDNSHEDIALESFSTQYCKAFQNIFLENHYGILKNEFRTHSLYFCTPIFSAETNYN